MKYLKASLSTVEAEGRGKVLQNYEYFPNWAKIGWEL